MSEQTTVSKYWLSRWKLNSVQAIETIRIVSFLQYQNKNHTIDDNISTTLLSEPYFGELHLDSTECHNYEVFEIS